MSGDGRRVNSGGARWICHSNNDDTYEVGTTRPDERVETNGNKFDIHIRTNDPIRVEHHASPGKMGTRWDKFSAVPRDAGKPYRGHDFRGHPKPVLSHDSTK
jgi:hypothetical protein